MAERLESGGNIIQGIGIQRGLHRICRAFHTCAQVPVTCKAVHLRKLSFGFDQYILEGTSEPSLHVVFSPQRADEVQHTLRIVGRFVALNYELFQLVEELQQWEGRHAGTLG
jgi:hypothetical protein